jgi:hypothetical protein
MQIDQTVRLIYRHIAIFADTLDKRVPVPLFIALVEKSVGDLANRALSIAEGKFLCSKSLPLEENNQEPSKQIWTRTVHVQNSPRVHEGTWRAEVAEPLAEGTYSRLK